MNEDRREQELLRWDKDRFGNRILISMELKLDGTIGYSVPGVVPYLMDYPTEPNSTVSIRIALSKKLMEMSDACLKKEWPFEEKS